VYGDNTIIVLWSDHGWHLGEKQHWGKWTGWERSTRVTLAVVPSRKMAPRLDNLGQTCDEPVSLLDLYPTLTELCGVPVPHALDGQSLVPWLKDPGHHTDRIVLTSFDPGNVSMRSRGWRYIRYHDGSEELYDLVDDPNEWDNLSDQPERASLLNMFRRQVPDDALKAAD